MMVGCAAARHICYEPRGKIYVIVPGSTFLFGQYLVSRINIIGGYRGIGLADSPVACIVAIRCSAKTAAGYLGLSVLTIVGIRIRAISGEIASIIIRIRA